MRRSAQALLALSALLTGAGGMGLQSVLLAYAGLIGGHSLSGAFGPGSFAAGWCVGAWMAGRHRGSTKRALAVLTFAAPVCAALVVAWLRSSSTSSVAPALAFAAIALAAAPQGMFLTLQCRAFSRARGAAAVGVPYVANLLGALLGAWWIGLEVVAASGRSGALLASNAAVVLGAALGLAGAGLAGAPLDEREPALPQRKIGGRDAAWIACVVAFWVFALEWLCLRIAVLWVGSEVGELTRVLACSLLALALGAAALPRLAPRDSRGVLVVLALAALGSTWPLWCSDVLSWTARELAPALRASAVFERVSDLPLTLVLVLPALAPLGAVIPVVHRAMSGESGARLGHIFLFEALGALAAGPLLHELIVPRIGVAGALTWLPLCGALASFSLFRHLPLRRYIAGVALLSVALSALARLAPAPALVSPKLSEPGLSVRAFGEDAHFAVSVVDDGLNGERTLLTDTFRAAGDGREYAYMRVLGHLPLLLHPRPARVAVVALGTGTTVGAVSLHDEVEALDVLEISSKVVQFAPWFESVNRGALAGLASRVDGAERERVEVLLGDGRRRLAQSGRRYDVISIEPLLPDSVFGVYLYTPEFYATVRAALAEGGLFAQWVPPHALPSDVCAAVVDAFARSFEWSSAWLAGTQLILIGGERPPDLDPARFPSGSGPLRDALVQLGLETPDGLRARWVADLRSWPASPRRLTDDDPWIVWRSRRSDAPVLEWLPRNLELVTASASAPPWPALDPGDARVRTLLQSREARIALAWSQARRRNGALDEPDALRLLEAAFGDAAPQARVEAEVRALYDEAEFLDTLRRGVALLRQGDSRGAVRNCVRAVELRPERCDTHLYLAVALQSVGEPQAADAALREAERRCPRWRETAPGQRALDLGLRAP